MIYYFFKGTAQRYNWLASLENLRPDTGKKKTIIRKCLFKKKSQIKYMCFSL